MARAGLFVMVNILKILLLLLVVNGCAASRLSLPFVDDRYTIDNNLDADEKRVFIFNPLESEDEIYFNGGTINDLGEYLRKNTFYSLVSDVGDTSINGIFVGGVSKIVSDIALSHSLHYYRIDKTFYLLQTPSENFNVSVCLVSPVSEDILKSIFNETFVYDNGCVVYNGSLFKALQLQDIIDSFASIRANLRNYVVTVVQVQTNKQLAYNFQVEISTKGVDLLQKGLSCWDVFQAIALLDGSSLDFDSYHERQFYLSDGKEFTYNQTFDKQLEQRSISDAGTSTVSGYNQLQAGSIITLKVNSSDGVNVFCDYDLELSSFEAGTTDKHVVKVKSSSVNFKLGEIYYIASSQDKTESKRRNIIGLGKDDSDDVTTIFVKIDKIS